MNVLIIEDEKAAARNLVFLLEEIDPTITIMAVVDSVVDSVEWLEANACPDLIFMDIHLADGAAFEIFDRCTVKSPIIFTTAYDEYAIKAFKVNSIDYLLKPISSSDLEQAIDKFRKLHQRDINDNGENLQQLIQSINRTQNHTTHLLLPKNGSRIVPLPIEEILCFFIEDGIVRAKCKDGTLHVVPHTLDQLSEMVEPTRFFRANRQFIIVKEDVVDIELWFGSRLSLRLRSLPNSKIIVNKPRVSEFKAWLSGSCR